MSRRRVQRIEHGPSWKWRTFPVLAAFIFGALIASFLDRPDTDFAVAVRIVLVLAGAYCFIHVVVTYLILPRRRRIVIEDRTEPEFEDELVYDDDNARRRTTSD
jgi:hypothetical protein